MKDSESHYDAQTLDVATAEQQEQQQIKPDVDKDDSDVDQDAEMEDDKEDDKVIIMINTLLYCTEQ